jgi:hypothetical protein
VKKVITKDHVWYFFLGWAAILGLKYVVLGLTAWNNLFHPGLIPAPNQQAYLQPFFGIFSGGNNNA